MFGLYSSSRKPTTGPALPAPFLLLHRLLPAHPFRSAAHPFHYGRDTKLDAFVCSYLISMAGSPYKMTLRSEELGEMNANISIIQPAYYVSYNQRLCQARASPPRSVALPPSRASS